MKLDSEAQRDMLLQLIAAVNLPGRAVKDAHALLVAIETADIETSDDGRACRKD